MNTQSGIRAESGAGNPNPGTDIVAVEKAGDRKLSGASPGSGPSILAGLWEFKIRGPGRVYIPGKQRYVNGPEQNMELDPTKITVLQIISLYKDGSS